MVERRFKMTEGIINRTIYTADNLEVLRGLPEGVVDLIYLDPPFNSKKQWENPIEAEGKKAIAKFKDTWYSSDINDDDELSLLRYGGYRAATVIDALAEVNGDAWRNYLIYMGVRLMECRRVLKDTGSIYLHCDPTMNAGLKLLMDSIFGAGNFRNEIIWGYRRIPAKQPQFQRMHDTILFYSKSAKGHTFNAMRGQMTDVSQRMIEQIRGYNVNKKKRMATVFDWDKYNAAVKRGDLPKGLTPQFSDGDNNPPMNACWTDIPIIAPTAKERNNYPTQKPLALLERIIKASSNEGDLVLDPFCGCASTCVAAENLGRQWMGIDIGEEAAPLVVDGLRKKSAQGRFESWNPANSPVIHINLMAKKKKVSVLPKLTAKKIKPPLAELPRCTKMPTGKKYDDTIAQLLSARGDKCAICGEPMGRDMSVDHITPRTRGGRDEIQNFQLTHIKCNSEKGEKTTAEARRAALERQRAKEMEEEKEKRKAELRAEALKRQKQADRAAKKK